MNCDEFEIVGLDLNQTGAGAEERAAALEHLRHCSRCAGLVESWEELRSELFLLGDSTREAQAPQRVEMRLRQEFRTRRRPFLFYRRAALIAAWSLAVALLIVAGVDWENWRHESQPNPGAVSKSTEVSSNTAPQNEVLLADSDEGAFTLLPGGLPLETEDAAVMQVRMQRGALSAFGLPVDPEHSSDWIRVDLLVGEDGTPEAVRLHQDVTQVRTRQ
jgi:anti-sigma factor RsiW